MSKRDTSPFVILLTLLATSFLLGPALADAPDPQDEGGTPPAEGEPPPIEWQPWSDELFLRARQRGRGVLLTVVTRWCKPCTMMDRDVWSDPEVRRQVAIHWIPVRIDNEDRPDLDSRYQKALAVLNRGKTGYPVTAFLFPTGEAMWADLTIPARNLEERPGLQALLPRMAELWRVRFETAKQNAMWVQGSFDNESNPRHEAAPTPVLFSAIVDGTIRREDREYGGYGPAPRTNNPVAARLLLRASERRRDEGLRRLAVEALRAAVRGAVYDRIEGGFHPGTLDRTWETPIFGKTLEANAAYLLAMARVVAATGDPELREAAERTVDYVIGVLQAPEGGFYSRQGPSADPEDHGSYYAWTVKEVIEGLDEDLERWARLLFGLKEEGEILLGLPRRFTLKTSTSVEEAAAATGIDEEGVRGKAREIVRILAAIRQGKPSPPVSGDRFVDGNALVISALLGAGAVLDREDAVAGGLKALDLILSASGDLEKGVPHRIGDGADASPRLMPDLVYLGNALADAYEISGDQRYLKAAAAAGEGLTGLYYDDEGGGGFFDVVEQNKAAGYVRLRRKPLGDWKSPSPQAEAIRLLGRLALLTGNVEAWMAPVEPSLEWVAPRLLGFDERSASFALVLDAIRTPRLQVTVSGDGELARSLARAAWLLDDTAAVVRRTSGSGESESASLCIGEMCREGIGSAGDLLAAAKELRARAATGEGAVAAP
jgi:uncharacterized protein YyaL (SSP411 family)